ncbi:uncharacterized protein LOC131009849 [Salvia miltiorrhiza]|uniref:uncharacterized protein LOC131009849 n=1 Tax=Salvia miltiorrhiza TaxID=226208 RepID=UPI0025AC700D|nr:uncharacterized protein LOC131009849 [Salvia miltiorrhiza]
MSHLTYLKAEGRPGGILTVWNPSRFACSSHWDIPGALIVNGRWNPDREELWNSIGLVVDQNRESCVCIGGDFNSVRSRSERMGRGSHFSARDIQSFDCFIRGNGLVDVRLQGRNFTWYQPQGLCKSKLDRFLVNEKWVSVEPQTKVRGLHRTVSDHCPILLETNYVDWGPKPFRFINAWVNHPDFERVVRESWNRNDFSGWKCYVFKEKLKRLKEDLKKWNKESFGSIDQNLEKLKTEINE